MTPVRDQIDTDIRMSAGGMLRHERRPQQDEDGDGFTRRVLSELDARWKPRSAWS
ncbi:hypothetical protein GCM10023113_00340 [Cellulomonas oligotrophica]|uniref:Uncharacterized protein n=1 Tax=Cellulomonas oligotrophica TaxID=931536 RepID=A0ABQ4DEY3_9CELL|nr:hypothetical protein Col01nite_34460 [Cellulomonas oligotrophica]